MQVVECKEHRTDFHVLRSDMSNNKLLYSAIACIIGIHSRDAAIPSHFIFGLRHPQRSKAFIVSRWLGDESLCVPTTFTTRGVK